MTVNFIKVNDLLEEFYKLFTRQRIWLSKEELNA
ncbi:Uncharacterised protein [Fusobacterium necrophorum subsp. necrophorum]|nr:Uncharacterised protein [Fusobacterium necrophorum subsp. necrophorum]